MEEKFSKEQLNNLDKDFLITLLLNMQEQISAQTESNLALRAQIEKLTEQIAIMNTRAFGRKSEKIITNDEQLSFFDDCFNEAEAIFSAQLTLEPEMEQVVIPGHTRKKRKGKREEDLSGYETIVIEHTLSEDELKDRFPEGYDKLPDEIYRKLEMIPASFEVHEHHIAVYKGKNGKFAKGEHPKEMLNNSIATPSLVAAVINAKYTNGMPLYRQEQECARNDVNISRQTMANWVIMTTERYISLVHDKIREEIKASHIIHADETPVMVTKDGREGMHKNYMWVYRTGDMCKANPAILYDYQKTRKADSPREFLNGFKGKLVCDGYQVYHALENEASTEFEVAGCWAHARRPFAEIVKSLGNDKAIGTVAYEALVQIQNIYHTDNSLKKLPPSKRKAQRKVLVKPLVEHYFEWAKDSLNRVPPNSATAAGIKYSLNQEKYLKTFLTDPEVPLDNNLAEQAIRPFCVGKKNWKLIDTVNGAKTSAILYSLVETAKANRLNIYQYFKYLLTEIPKHMDDTNLNFLNQMLPWSKELPEICHKKLNLKK
ncbi:MAG: IS66 family transposase [Lachnospiraceae bacterium]|nr:IS66 family transposase [Lachnospiraceae bacterium]